MASPTYNQIAVEAAKLLGSLVGAASVAAAETAYTTTLAAATLVNPDRPPTFIQDAVLGAVCDVVQTICETRDHPERADFLGVTAALESGDLLPTVSAGGAKLVGVMGRVKNNEETDSTTLMLVGVDRVRSYNQFKNTIYRDANLYLYAIDQAGTIEHTRNSVLIEWPAFSRPVYTATDPIPLRDWHERGLVWLTVAFLAAAEDAYSGLRNVADAEATVYKQQIRTFGGQEGLPPIQRAVATR